MKGTVPKRLDIYYDFGTFSTILNFYFFKEILAYFWLLYYRSIPASFNSQPILISMTNA